jgi:hypothetical protein
MQTSPKAMRRYCFIIAMRWVGRKVSLLTVSQGIRESILATVQSLPPNALIGILTFARVVSVYKLTHIAPVSADAIPGNAPLEEFDLSQLEDKRDVFIVGVEHARRHLSNIPPQFSLFVFLI